ncbi:MULTISPECIES: MFS transporter [Metabacillus]|uniref:MFS transporter n=1 Tax=Metabacillus hrfriensis TaxID=3048891 RepID=A0ACD4R7W4_9BACI|nr:MULTISPECIES: MFS transporter [Metabacillus]UAL51048.1 MFS transporter [Metabacillus dongyingensis]WHZ56551.1 MFS transporter [Metabacillus sp. CT-WN-B3]
MSKLQKLFGDVEVNKELILLLIIGGLYSLGIALSNAFVNVYLWKQSGSFLDLGIYNLSIAIMQPVTFVIAGRWAKKIDRVIVFRLGVAFLAVFYLSVLLIGNDAADNIILLGGLLGIGSGFYWLSFNVLTFEITEPETRDFFNGFLGIMSSSAGMIGPIVAGFVISRFAGDIGYKSIFSISLGLFFCAVILSLFLKRRHAHGRYLLLEVLKERKRNVNWRMITNAHFFQGIREGTFIFVIGVLVFITTGSEFALGKYGLINSAVAFVFYYLATRLITKKMRKKSILIGGILLYASIFLLLFDLTYPKLIMYAISIAIAYPMLLVPYISLTYDVIGRSWNAAEARIEYIVVREIFLNLGRISSILLFILAVTLFDEKQSIPILLAVIGSGHSFIYFFIRKVTLLESNEPINDNGQKNMPEPNLVDGESS